MMDESETALVTQIARDVTILKETVQTGLAIDALAIDMKRKMHRSATYKGRSGWDDPLDCPPEFLAEALVHHVFKGDPVDIANFCMMLHARKVPFEDIQRAVGVAFRKMM